MKEKRDKKITLIAITIFIAILSGFGFYEANQNKSTEEIIESAVQEVKEQISTYEMSEEEIKELSSTEIKEQTEEQEKEVSKEQEVESEGFELQGEIAYEGDRARTWNVELGDYKGLTYYSQIDSRWSSHSYTSIGDYSQTIGTSGCGPTCRSNDCNSNPWQHYSRKNAEMIGFLTDIGLLTKVVIGQHLDI